MDINTQKLSNLLQNYISKQTDENSLLSDSQISQKLNIPTPTFHRILNGRSKPSLETLIKLSKFIPEIKEFLPKELFEVILEKTKGEILGKRLEVLLLDADMFLIYVLAFSDKGITEDYIVKNFGSKKIEKLKTLEKEGFIKREGNGLSIYRVTRDRQMTQSFELIKKHIKILNRFYKTQQPESNYAFYGIDRLNKKGVKELMKANKSYHKKVVDIMSDKENKGDISVFATGVSDLLFEKSLTIEGESENEIKGVEYS